MIPTIVKEVNRSKNVISRIWKLYDYTGSFKSPITSGQSLKIKICQF